MKKIIVTLLICSLFGETFCYKRIKSSNENLSMRILEIICYNGEEYIAYSYTGGITKTFHKCVCKNDENFQSIYDLPKEKFNKLYK